MRPSPKLLWGIGTVLVFFLSRLLYSAAGITFDSSPLYSSWGFLDPAQLQENLFSSIYFLHGQPPLFNLFLGAILKLAPQHMTLTFQTIYLSCGLVLTVTLYHVQVRIGLPPSLSALMTAAFIANPATILYENFLFYTYPVATLLCLIALSTHLYIDRGRMRHGVVLFILVGALVMTRSLFHGLFYFLVLLIIVLLRKDLWRTTLIAAALPGTIVVLWYLKNLLLFGTLTSSTWFGMNLAKITTFSIPEPERSAMVARHELSPYALIPPFSSLGRYDIHQSDQPETRAPVLSEDMKSTAHVNYNNTKYIEISKEYLKDAVYVIEHRPILYGRNVLYAVFVYCRPAGEYFLLEPNRSRIDVVEQLAGRIACGELQRKEITLDRGVQAGDVATQLLHTGLFVLFGIPAVAAFTYRRARSLACGTPDERANAATMLFILFIVIYVCVVGNVAEIGENNRFRFNIDPLLTVLVGILLHRLWVKFRPRKTQR